MPAEGNDRSMRKTTGQKVFQVINITIMLIIVAAVVFPVLNIISMSVSDTEAIVTNSVGIFPKGLNTEAYRRLLFDRIFIRSLFNTVGITIISTVLSLLVISMTAYGLSKEFKGQKVINYYFVITMYFSGGLIPTYLLLSKYLAWRNTYWVYIFPALVNVFYIIVVKSQIKALPGSILDAAAIDGANDFQILFRIVLPSISPTIAAISMFSALDKWNMWFPAMLYADNRNYWTAQYFLRAVVFDKIFTSSEAIAVVETVSPINYQMATIVLIALPVVAIYPFVQKYFVKGILAGSVKG